MTKSVIADFQNDAKCTKRRRFVKEGRRSTKKEDHSRGTIFTKNVDFSWFLTCQSNGRAVPWRLCRAGLMPDQYPRPQLLHTLRPSCIVKKCDPHEGQRTLPKPAPPVTRSNSSSFSSCFSCFSSTVFFVLFSMMFCSLYWVMREKQRTAKQALSAVRSLPV